MVINLEEYRQARAQRLPVRRAEEDRLCVNWDPAYYGAIAMACYQSMQELSPELPDDAAVIQPDFVSRVFALATQI